jgi:hypothetical protein
MYFSASDQGSILLSSGPTLGSSAPTPVRLINRATQDPCQSHRVSSLRKWISKFWAAGVTSVDCANTPCRSYLACVVY